MSVGSHRRRLSAKPPGAKCVQCNHEPRLAGRTDQLGAKCAKYADDAKRKVGKEPNGK